MLKRISGSLVMLCFALLCHADPGSNEAVRTAVQHYIDSICNVGVPGVSVTYRLPDGTTQQLAAGFSNTEQKIAMKPGDIFLSGSAPKMYYATIALMLARDKKINLDDKVEKYLGTRSWYSRLPNADGITVRQLLNHTAGIAEYYELGDFFKRLRDEPEKQWMAEELIGYVLDTKPLFPPGEQFSYADTHYIILGLILEQVMKQGIYLAVDQRILKPLSMKNTSPSSSKVLPGMVVGYSSPQSPFGVNGPMIRDGKFVLNPEFEGCGGGYVSNTSDWVNFIYQLMNGKLLAADWMAQMKTGVKANTGKDHLYGLGLQIRPSPWGLTYGHGGWFPGYLTEVEFMPETNTTVAIQVNTDDFAVLKGHPRKHLLNIAALISRKMGAK